MSWLVRFRSFASMLLRGRRAEREMDEEWQFHREARVDALVAGGLPRDEAERRARDEFGDPLRWKEQAREVRGLGWLHDLAADVRYGVRSLRRAPAFTLTAVAILTLGVGLNTAVFSVVNGLLLRPAPLPDRHEVVRVFGWHTDPRHAGGVSPAEYRFLHEHTTTVGLVAIAQGIGDQRIQRDGAEARVQTRLVSGNYFDVLRVPLAIGRGFRPHEDEAGDPATVAVIGDALWRDLFDGGADVIGQSLRVNGVPFDIIGVAAPGANHAAADRTPGIWVPLATCPLIMQDSDFTRGFLTNGSYCCVDLVGRLRPGVSRSAAANDLSRIAGQSPGSEGEPRGMLVTGTSAIAQPWNGQASVVVALLAAGVVLVLLVACANVGNLQLARAVSRRHELAIRGALGAGRARIVRQLLTEGFLLAAAAVAASLGGLVVMLQVVGRRLPPGPVDDLAALVSPDLRVFAFSALLATTAVLAAGIGPALAGTRRLAITGPLSNDARVRLRSVFLAAQVALSLVLLMGAALLARGVMHGTSLIPSGVNDVVRMDVSMGQETSVVRPAPSEEEQRMHEAVYEALVPLRPDALAAASEAQPVTVRLPGQAPPAGRSVSAYTVSPSFFPLLRIRHVSGELLREGGHDADVVVNESFARLFWPGEPALGRTFVATTTEAGEPLRVAGVVADAWIDSAGPPGPSYFRRGTGLVIVRTESDAIAAIRTAVAGIDPRAQLRFVPMRSPASALQESTLVTALVALPGSIALGLASVGVFGVLAYLSNQRSREIAIRLALGARMSHVVRIVGGEVFGALAAGAAAGLAISLAVAPVLRSLLFGLTPHDPLAYLSAMLVLMGAVLLASIRPIARAASTDPALTLRQE